MKKIFSISLFLAFFALVPPALARSTHSRTIGVFVLGNFQLFDNVPEYDPGPGGGMYFDYRFNQRFSVTLDAWASTHDGTGRSQGDDGLEILGLPNLTLKMYLTSDESNPWDPYIGCGLGVYAISEGTVANGSNGVGLGAQVDLGFDYHLSDMFSVGFAGIYRSAGVINSLSGSGNTSALIPFSLLGRVGFHF